MAHIQFWACGFVRKQANSKQMVVESSVLLVPAPDQPDACPQKPARVPYFSKLNRAQLQAMQAKSVMAKRQAQTANDQPSKAVATEADGYIAGRLERVRKQLDEIDERIAEEACKKGEPGPDGKPGPVADGQLLNWLCSAQERLSEQERVLSRRPLPGSERPSSGKPARSGSIFGTPMPSPAAPAQDWQE
jgi:hypothetical protein